MLNDSISLLVETYIKNKKDCGTVGCRLHYEDGTLQHLGMIITENKEGMVGVSHRFLGWDYKNTLITQTRQQTHGNTGAFMLINKNLFESCGCFNEEYVECFEDVELNLKCYLKGKKNITNSNAVCYHLESQTRGKSVNKDDVTRILTLINSEGKIKKTTYKI